VFANFLNKDHDFYSNNYIGALGSHAARLRDAFEEYCRILVFEIPKALVIVVAGLAVIALKSPKLAIMCVVCVLFTVGITIFLARFRLKYRRILSQASNKLDGVLGDGISHGATVKSFAQESYEQKRLSQPLDNWVTAQLKTWDSSIPHTFARHILLALTMAVLLVVSGKLYQDGAISIAIVTLVQLYVIRIMNTTLEIGDNIKKYEAVMSAAYEPVATMLVQATIKDPDSPTSLVGKPSYEVSFKNVSYRYPEAATKTYAVQDFTLTVNNGEKIGLVGYSGGGKTTITKLLLRFTDVSRGSICIDGVDVRQLKQTELRNLIAYVPQEPLLFHRSIQDNIAYGKPAASKKAVEQAAKTAYVDEFVKELPAGYKAMVGERGVKLSGGQRQRVAIARALLKNAPILVLDEATSALDSQSEQYIQKALWALMKDKTAIVIAHRLSTIQRMDRIAVMDRGSIVEIGTHQELLKNKKGIYARLWARQSDGYLGEDPNL
jgi:ATP-binding cassette subfamily B protein